MASPDDTGGRPAALDREYVLARRVLLDALEALSPHGPAVILAGAQAVYLHTRQSQIGIAPYTTDGDLALDPALLGDEPKLGAAMRQAGFELLETPTGHSEPGIWTVTVAIDGDELTIPIDLIVPEGVASAGGRRGARLGPHGNRAARRAVGLEAALVDHAPMAVGSLEPADRRSFVVEVAGPAALLVAKSHKIHDRLQSPRQNRVDDKDAADVYRLMQATSPGSIGKQLAELREDEIAGPATGAAAIYLTDLFGRRNGPGIQMAARALRLAVPEEQITVFATAYIEKMLDSSS
jgi:ribosomal protein L11